jgi:hypothetical protein
MVQNGAKKEQKQRDEDVYTDNDYDEDAMIAMAQYERVIRNSNRIKVKDKKYNKRHNRIYDDEI